MDVQGRVASGFESVREVMASRTAELDAGGAALAAYVDGELVVDLWCGDAAPGQPWQEETRAVLMSATKGAAALCVALLVDRGELDVDLPAAHYWPEFAANGKAGVTVRQVLDHSSGTITLPGYADLLQWDGRGWDERDEIESRVAVAAPEWEPGTAHGYHALTCGWQWNGLVRRITGSSIGTFFRDEIAAPLGLDLEIGTPAENRARVARVVELDLTALPEELREALEPLMEQNRDPSTLTGKAFLARDGTGVLDVLARLMNNPRVLATEVPAGNGTGTARALARMYALLAGGGSLDGVDLISPETIGRFTTEQRTELDMVLGMETSRGLGFFLNRVQGPLGNTMGPNVEAFGHSGAGGQQGFADPVRKLGLGFVRNALTLAPHHGMAMVAAVYEAAGNA